jgi:DNA-binding NtrC family response regulator
MTDQRPAARVATLVQRLDAFEKQLIEQALRDNDNEGDKDEAAKSLGLSVTTLELKVERLNFEDGARQRSPGARAEW